jgi:hypothetical protein
MGLSNYCRIKDDGPPAIAISQNIVNKGLEIKFVSSPNADLPRDDGPLPASDSKAIERTPPVSNEATASWPQPKRIIEKDASGFWREWDEAEYRWRWCDAPETEPA